MPLIEFDNRGLEEISVDSLDNSLVITSKLCDRALRNQFEGYRFLHMRPQTSATNQFAESAPIARVEYLQTAHTLAGSHDLGTAIAELDLRPARRWRITGKRRDR
jgi:hypothetical protein